MKPSPPGPTILLLGTGHWGNPTIDYLNPQYDDMLGMERQSEIQECLGQLQRFQPTKVALEVPYERAGQLNEQYRQYRAGSFALTASEIHQLGFRLADLSNHDQLYAIDWHDTYQNIGWESAIEFARHHDQMDLISWFDSRQLQKAEAREAQSISASSVRDMLLEANDAHGLERSHQIYMDLMRVGEDAQYIGADVICRWYERNMKMCVNLTRVATAPGERLIVIVGAGHVPLLTHFIESSGRYILERVQSYYL